MSAQPSQIGPGPQPGQLLLQTTLGYQATACLSIAVRLKIADFLAAAPKSVRELAVAANVQEDGLYRVLRLLATIGVFRETGPRTFANTPTSQLLRTDTRESLRDVVMWLSDPFHLRIFADLMHSVETGEPAIKKLTGCDAFEYFQRDREEGAVFHSAMVNLSSMLVPPVLEAYDFSGLGTLADIAGGHGKTLASILEKHGDLRGIVFDLPDVARDAQRFIESAGLAGRCKVVAGNFFESVPAADSYLLKSTIHDWDDAQACAILQNCARAMRGRGKVILIELAISPGNELQLSKWIDLEMLALPGGRERTEEEYAALFSRAGLRLSRVVPTKSAMCVIEGVTA